MFTLLTRDRTHTLWAILRNHGDSIIAFSPFTIAGFPEWKGIEIHETNHISEKRFQICLSDNQTSAPPVVYDPMFSISQWVSQQKWFDLNDENLYTTIAQWRSNTLQVTVKITSGIKEANVTGISIGCNIEGVSIRDYTIRSALRSVLENYQYTILRYGQVSKDARSFGIPPKINWDNITDITIKSIDKTLKTQKGILQKEQERIIVKNAFPVDSVCQIRLTTKVKTAFQEFSQDFFQVSNIPFCLIVYDSEHKVENRRITGSIRVNSSSKYWIIETGATINIHLKIVFLAASLAESLSLVEQLASWIEQPLYLPLYGIYVPVRLLDIPRPTNSVGTEISPSASEIKISLDKIPSIISIRK